MTTEELKAALNEAHKDDDPGHREMWIEFVLEEVKAGTLKPVMEDGELCLEMVFMPAGVEAEA
jgi:hypothetical protein